MGPMTAKHDTYVLAADSQGAWGDVWHCHCHTAIDTVALPLPHCHCHIDTATVALTLLR
jgi:hypothetical protein